MKNDIRIRSNSCFGRNQTILSENYTKVYCDVQHAFLCCVFFAFLGKYLLGQNNGCVYFALLGKITAGHILPLAEHD